MNRLMHKLTQKIISGSGPDSGASELTEPVLDALVSICSI
jgi:hypothetical protein